jgi:transcriptional regulator with XRE-family HTH domain
MSGTYRRTFIRKWRQYRGLTLEELGARLDLTHGNLSRIERGLRPYSQETLEGIARELNTDPASLLERDPEDPEGIWAVWESLPRSERAKAIEFLKILGKPNPAS